MVKATNLTLVVDPSTLHQLASTAHQSAVEVHAVWAAVQQASANIAWSGRMAGAWQMLTQEWTHGSADAATVAEIWSRWLPQDARLYAETDAAIMP